MYSESYVSTMIFLHDLLRLVSFNNYYMNTYIYFMLMVYNDFFTFSFANFHVQLEAFACGMCDSYI